MHAIASRLVVDQDDVVEAAIGILRQRMQGEGEGLKVGNPVNLLRHAALQLHEERREVFMGYWVDANWRLLGVDVLAIGNEQAVVFSLADLARKAIAAKAVYAYFLHNHPGERYARPSDKDFSSLAQIDEYLGRLGITPVNHFVLSRETAYCARSHQVFHFLEDDR